MANIEKQMLTEEGKKKYEEELAYLIDVVRPQVTQEIKEAKEQGNLQKMLIMTLQEINKQKLKVELLI